jgi:8-oxo-dGTP pyrophosphatase MutT (NUDIX family)
MITAELHPSVAAFVERARVKLSAMPRMAGRDAPGDFAINGIQLKPERIALLKPAAVLIALNRETGGVLFTERAKHLSNHPGQISFPGGRIDPTDDGPLSAAMREADEEVGMPASVIQPIGFLDEYFTGTGFRVTPVVALVDRFQPKLDPNEVGSIFEAPLEFLMDLSHHEEHFREFEGKPRRSYAIAYKSHYIWGVTAGIIRCLQERVFG